MSKEKSKPPKKKAGRHTSTHVTKRKVAIVVKLMAMGFNGRSEVYAKLCEVCEEEGLPVTTISSFDAVEWKQAKEQIEAYYQKEIETSLSNYHNKFSDIYQESRAVGDRANAIKSLDKIMSLLGHDPAKKIEIVGGEHIDRRRWIEANSKGD